MKDIFKDYLFQHHILVYDQAYVTKGRIHFDSLITLANKFGIRITKGAELANVQMIHDAERNLGINVPEPFYRGFPETVREMTPDQLLYDQLYHYTQTYGLGWFDEPGHSVLENYQVSYKEIKHDHMRTEFDSKMFPEATEPKDFIILNLEDSFNAFASLMKGLCSSSRPLNTDQEIILLSAYKEYGHSVIADEFKCKMTAIKLLYYTRDMIFAKSLRLPDVIKVLEHIQYTNYCQNENLNKLNLKNQDRKFITKLIDHLLNSSRPSDLVNCFEKQKIWCGLLHHIHYKPQSNNGRDFVNKIRSGVNYSVMSDFEYHMGHMNPAAAAIILAKHKGSGAVMRNLNYILSRCKNENEVEEVLSICLE